MKNILLILLFLFTLNSFSQAVYKIENDTLKGWTGKSEFKKPILVGGVVVEGWTAQDQIKKDSILNQNILDNDTSAIKNYSYKDDGQIAHKRIWDRIMREYDTGNITNAQFEQISNVLFDAVLPLDFGLWKVAKSKIDATQNPTNAKLLAIKVKVQEIINTYIAENY